MRDASGRRLTAGLSGFALLLAVVAVGEPGQPGPAARAKGRRARRAALPRRRLRRLPPGAARGGGQVGLDLTHVASLDLKAQRPPGKWPDLRSCLRESIERPDAYVVPGFKAPSDMPSAETLKLSARDVDDLIAYLLTLK